MSFCIINGCNNEKNKKDSYNHSTIQTERTIDLAITHMSIAISNSGEYVAWIEYVNNGDTTADKYDIVFEWRCPTDPNFINYSTIPRVNLKPIKAGGRALNKVICRFACKPRPIRIPCTFYILNAIPVRDSDTTNNKKSIDYILK